MISVRVADHESAHPSSVVSARAFLDWPTECLISLPGGVKVIDHEPKKQTVRRVSLSRIRQSRPMVVFVRAGWPPPVQAEQYFAVIAQNLIEILPAWVRLSTP